ncbi:MAG TPA: VWA domain-containing protein [Allosphingosinicella sp.]|uniref:vWA domain-containing protein n=1 Tax=Allosphingosinicella sp. TaxID=2823234 RepID=UPI002EDA790A
MLLLLGGAALLTACPQEEPAGNGSAAASASDAPRNLPAEWYADADRNFIPDFIEQQIGYSPTADDCPVNGACGNGAAGSSLKVASNILLILDSSGSMAARLGGRPKIDLAKQSLNSFMSGLPNAASIGFMVYGHRGNNTPAGKAESCAGVELLAPIGAVDKAAVPQLLARFEPRGWTPIGDSLKAARTAFAGKAGNRIILVSDGLETCGGDPVAVARELKTQGLDVRVDVVGFDVQSADAAALRQIAEAGGGEYFNARTHRELDEYFRRQNLAAAQSLGDAVCEMERNNEAMLCDGRLQNAAISAINRQAQSFRQSGDQQAYAEAGAMRGKIMQHFSERNAARASIRQRSNALAKQGQQTIRQSMKTSEQLKTQ